MMHNRRKLDPLERSNTMSNLEEQGELNLQRHVDMSVALVFYFIFKLNQVRALQVFIKNRCMNKCGDRG